MSDRVRKALERDRDRLQTQYNALLDEVERLKNGGVEEDMSQAHAINSTTGYAPVYRPEKDDVVWPGVMANLERAVLPDLVSVITAAKSTDVPWSDIQKKLDRAMYWIIEAMRYMERVARTADAEKQRANSGVTERVRLEGLIAERDRLITLLVRDPEIGPGVRRLAEESGFLG